MRAPVKTVLLANADSALAEARRTIRTGMYWLGVERDLYPLYQMREACKHLQAYASKLARV